MKTNHRKGSTKVNNDRDVMCLPVHDVKVFIFATFKMCYDNFHNAKLLYFAYLSQILIKGTFLLPMSFKSDCPFWQLCEFIFCAKLSTRSDRPRMI